MYNFLSVFAILICATVGGPFNPNPFPRCDSELIIIGCEESPGNCCLIPGHIYKVQLNYTPIVPAISLDLKYEIEHNGFIYTIIDVRLPNSAVEAGVEYPITINVVPNDILEGEKIVVRLSIYHTDNPSLGACGRAEINVGC